MGCYQNYGVDYSDPRAPVLNEIPIRLFLMTFLNNKKWVIQKLDIEANLDEEVYILLPKGLNDITKYSKKFYRLNKSLYGLVQAFSKFHKELKGDLIDNMKFIQSKCEPGLF